MEINGTIVLVIMIGIIMLGMIVDRICNTIDNKIELEREKIELEREKGED